MILITGGAGFLGRKITEKLIDSQQKARVIDLKSTGLPDGAEFFRGDITRPEDIEAAMDGVDVVIHLAAAPHPRYGYDAIQRLNLYATRDILKIASQNNVRRFVFASTHCVYGFPPPQPCTEEILPNPPGNYALSKWEGEKMCMDTMKRTGMEVVIVRIIAIMGPGFWGEPAFLDMIERAVKGKTLFVMGKGDVLRQYTSLDAAADFFILCAGKKEAAGEVFNMGNNEVVTDRQVMEYVIEGAGTRPRIIPVLSPFVKFGMRITKMLGIPQVDEEYENAVFAHTEYSVEKAKRILGWEAKTSTREAVIQTVNWYKGVLEKREEERKGFYQRHRDLLKYAGSSTLITVIASLILCWILSGIDPVFKLRGIMLMASLVCLVTGSAQMFAPKKLLNVINIDSLLYTKTGALNTIMLGLVYGLPFLDLERFFIFTIFSIISKTSMLLIGLYLLLFHKAPRKMYGYGLFDLFLAVLTLAFVIEYI